MCKGSFKEHPRGMYEAFQQDPLFIYQVWDFRRFSSDALKCNVFVSNNPRLDDYKFISSVEKARTEKLKYWAKGPGGTQCEHHTQHLA